MSGRQYEEDNTQLSRTFLDPTRGGPVPNLSIVNPVYGLTSGAAYNLSSRPYARSESESQRWGVYLQDQILLGERFIVIGGVRHDRFDDLNKINGVGFDDSDLTWRAGLIYKPRADVSVYASWSAPSSRKPPPARIRWSVAPSIPCAENRSRAA